LLQIHSCFFSHSKYVAYRRQQPLSRCITCQDVCVQESHAVKRLLPWASTGGRGQNGYLPPPGNWDFQAKISGKRKSGI